MKVREDKRAGVIILRVLHPRLDQAVAPDFKTEILRLVEKESEQKILVDLKEVDYCDSSGLGALLFGLRQAKSKSGTLKLVNVNPKVFNLIRIAKLDKVLQSFDDESDAVQSFGWQHVD